MRFLGEVMIYEYRFKAISPEGRMVQGTYTVGSKKEAKEHLAKLQQKYQLRIRSVEQNVIFLYKVTVPGKPAISGRLSAFSRDEVASALTKLGYSNYKINPVLLNLPIRPSNQDVLMFIKLSTTMLKDKMSFGKILGMLAEEQSNRAMKDALIQIENQLKAGAEGREVFMRFTNVFGKFPAFMLGLATRSGNMADVFEATSKFIERDVEIQKNVKKALISPLVCCFGNSWSCDLLCGEDLPATAELFLQYKIPLPPMTQEDFGTQRLAGKNLVVAFDPGGSTDCGSDNVVENSFR